MKTWQIYCGWAVLICICIVGTVWLNAEKVRENAMLSRVEKLEQQMREKMRPVIHVDYATIYNSDGEIVVETISDKETEK